MTDTTKTDTLASCPFGGDNPKLTVWTPQDGQHRDYGGGAWIATVKSAAIELSKSSLTSEAVAIEAAIAAWNTRAAPTVNPLVWEEPSKANNQCKIARAINGDYYVDACGGRHQAWLESITKPYEVQIGEMVGTMTEAKAAADAHHAAMILSSLEGVTG